MKLSRYAAYAHDEHAQGTFNYFISFFVMSCTVKHMTLFIISRSIFKCPSKLNTN